MTALLTFPDLDERFLSAEAWDRNADRAESYILNSPEDRQAIAEYAAYCRARASHRRKNAAAFARFAADERERGEARLVDDLIVGVMR